MFVGKENKAAKGIRQSLAVAALVLSSSAGAGAEEPQVPSSPLENAPEQSLVSERFFASLDSVRTEYREFQTRVERTIEDPELLQFEVERVLGRVAQRELGKVQRECATSEQSSLPSESFNEVNLPALPKESQGVSMGLGFGYPFNERVRPKLGFHYRAPLRIDNQLQLRAQSNAKGDASISLGFELRR